MDQLMEILEGLHPEVDFTMEQSLMDDGILDSFDLVSLIGDLCDNFEITIHGQEIIPDNFNNVEAMWSLIQNKLNEA